MKHFDYTDEFIRPMMGDPIRSSRNLRGLLDYARRVRPVRLITRIDRGSGGRGRGLLTVVYADGCHTTANFACFNIMIDWTRNRRVLRQCEAIHLDGSLGYLTRTGVIAGA